MAINSSEHPDTETIRPPAEQPIRRQGVVTGRALLIGAVGAAGVGLLAPWAIHVLRGSFMALDFSTPAAVGLMFFLVAGPNLLVLRFRRSLALTAAELITIYTMMIVASAIPTMGLTAQVIPISTGAHYYASPENGWGESILPYIPAWLVPKGTAVDAPVIRHLYEGLPAGGNVPWGAWSTSMAAWLAFLLSLHLVMICMMVLLRKQWVENERLAYPLTHLPLMLAGADSEGRPVILGKATFWIGMSIPFVLGSLIGLHNYFPGFPRINLAPNVTLVEGLWGLSFRFSFPMIGFFYLVNLETSFSLWFFSLLTQCGKVVMQLVGISSQENLGGYGAPEALLKYLGGGAFLALVASNLWVARGHLRNIWMRVVGTAGPEVDSGEVVSYRTAFWGMIIGLVAMGWWLASAGLPLIVVPLFLLIAMAIFLGLTRIVVESGMAVARPPVIASGLTAGLLGWDVLGAGGIVTLAQAFIWSSDIRTFVMCSVANSLKMADVVRERRRLLWLAFWVAIALALTSSIWLTMARAYAQGGTTMNSWFFKGATRYAYTWAADWIAQQPTPSVTGWILVAAGGAVFWFLTMMRFRFMQWPFHPIGFCIGGTNAMAWVWFPCFLTWVVKSGILRYGGMKLYETARPIFLGLICGQYATNLVWLVIDWLSGHTGNVIFWI